MLGLPHNYGATAPRCLGAQVPRCLGAEVLRCRGAQVLRCLGRNPENHCRIYVAIMPNFPYTNASARETAHSTEMTHNRILFTRCSNLVHTLFSLCSHFAPPLSHRHDTPHLPKCTAVVMQYILHYRGYLPISPNVVSRYCTAL